MKSALKNADFINQMANGQFDPLNEWLLISHLLFIHTAHILLIKSMRKCENQRVWMDAWYIECQREKEREQERVREREWWMWNGKGM